MSAAMPASPRHAEPFASARGESSVPSHIVTNSRPLLAQTMRPAGQDHAPHHPAPCSMLEATREPFIVIYFV